MLASVCNRVARLYLYISIRLVLDMRIAHIPTTSNTFITPGHHRHVTEMLGAFISLFLWSIFSACLFILPGHFPKIALNVLRSFFRFPQTKGYDTLFRNPFIVKLEKNCNECLHQVERGCKSKYNWFQAIEKEWMSEINKKQHFFYYPPSSRIASCVGTAGMVTWCLHLPRPCGAALGQVLIWVVFRDWSEIF